MKKKNGIISLSLAMSLLIASPVTLSLTQALLDTYDQSFVKLRLRHLNYAEKGENGAPNPLDTEKGFLPGLELGLTRRLGRLIITASVSLNQGNADYDGYLQGDEKGNFTPYRGKSKQTFTLLNLRLGWLIAGQATAFQPFIEAGWRRWHRGSLPIAIHDDNNLKLLINGYSEVYSHYQLLAGLTVANEFNRDLIGRLTLAAGTTLSVDMETDSPFTGAKEIGTIHGHYHLGSCPTALANIELDYRLAAHIYASTSLGYRYLAYGKSRVSRVGVFEPSSKTNEADVAVGLKFDFY